MRERIVTAHREPERSVNPLWLALEEITEVEVTSEDPSHPVEGALHHGDSAGWRAQDSGVHTIRLLFDEPRTIREIELRFTEKENERQQEVVLSWSAGAGA